MKKIASMFVNDIEVSYGFENGNITVEAEIQRSNNLPVILDVAEAMRHYSQKMGINEKLEYSPRVNGQNPYVRLTLKPDTEKGEQELRLQAATIVGLLDNLIRETDLNRSGGKASRFRDYFVKPVSEDQALKDAWARRMVSGARVEGEGSRVRFYTLADIGASSTSSLEANIANTIRSVAEPLLWEGASAEISTQSSRDVNGVSTILGVSFTKEAEGSSARAEMRLLLNRVAPRVTKDAATKLAEQNFAIL